MAQPERLVEIPKTRRASVTGLKSIESGEVSLEDSKEFVTGENSGWIAADRLSRDFAVSEEDFAVADFLDKAHIDPYAPDIPKYILNGTEEQSRSYGMGFDFGVSNAVKAGLEATPAVEQSNPFPASASGKTLLAIGLPLLALYHLFKKAMNKHSK